MKRVFYEGRDMKFFEVGRTLYLLVWFVQ